MTVEEAKQVLRKAGYQVDNLWHIEDVKVNYDCTDDEAMEVLEKALGSSSTIERIWFVVDYVARENNLEEK